MKSSVVPLKKSKNGTGYRLVKRGKKTKEFYRNYLLERGRSFPEAKNFRKTQEESAGCLLDS